MNDRHASQAEQRQVADPDPPVQVHGLLTVIPPSGVEDLFEHIAGQVFHDAADQEGQGEGRHDAGFNAGQIAHDDGDQHHPKPVNGKYWPRQEPAVDKAVVLAVFEYDLHAPARKTKDKELQDDIDPVRHTSISFQRSGPGQRSHFIIITHFSVRMLIKLIK